MFKETNHYKWGSEEMKKKKNRFRPPRTSDTEVSDLILQNRYEMFTEIEGSMTNMRWEKTKTDEEGLKKEENRRFIIEKCNGWNWNKTKGQMG